MNPPVVQAWRQRRHSPTAEGIFRTRIEREARAHTRRGRTWPQRVSAVLFLDSLELGLGRVPFLDDPVQRLEEIVDAGVRSLGHAIPHDLVDLARTLASEQQLSVF